MCVCIHTNMYMHIYHFSFSHISIDGYSADFQISYHKEGHDIQECACGYLCVMLSDILPDIQL